MAQNLEEQEETWCEEVEYFRQTALIVVETSVVLSKVSFSSNLIVWGLCWFCGYWTWCDKRGWESKKLSYSVVIVNEKNVTTYYRFRINCTIHLKHFAPIAFGQDLKAHGGTHFFLLTTLAWWGTAIIQKTI